MTTLTVGAASLNLIPLHFEHNARVLKSALADAQSQGIQLLCLPELSLTGYGCEDAFLFEHVSHKAIDSLFSLLPHTKNIATAFGLPLWIEGQRYNSIAFVIDGEIKGFVCKQHLAADGVHYEQRWFAPWKQGQVTFLSLRGKEYPCGDLVFDLENTRIGFEICEDAWVDDRPGYSLAARGVDIILNPSASHFSIDKVDIRRGIVVDGSTRFDALYVYANILGNEAGRIIYDGDTLIAQNGEILKQGPRLSLKEYILTGCSVTFEEKAKVYTDAHTIRCTKLKAGASRLKNHSPASWEASPARRYEEFMRAATLGLFDYMRKSFSQGFVLSLSGGADSACVAILVSFLAQRIVAELTEKEFESKVSYWKEMAEKGLRSPVKLMEALLTTVYQATENSSKITEDAARVLAESIGSHHTSLSIQSILAEYLKSFEKVSEEPLTWDTHDISLQNIQARVRSPGIWLVANVKRAILLTTSNRSESVVGYTTMDGDSSGGLAPIAGVSKHFVQGFLKHLFEKGLEGIDPQVQLSGIVAQQPTAELRPANRKQTDEKDLMPYIVLEQIEKMALRDHVSPEAVREGINERFSSTYPTADLLKWVEAFYRLWRSSQWKRERTAPSFHLDDFNVDPRSWFRFPILSGGL